MDRRVELRREISSEDAKLFAGRIKFVKGKYINVVILKKFTPGVCEETHDNKMVVSFENGSGKNLTFDADQKSIVPTNVTITADKKKNNNKGLDVFTLVGESWAKQEGNYYTGKVMYDNIEYTLRFGTHHRVRYNAPGPYMPSLLIKKNSIRNILIERRTIRGKVLR